MGAADGPCIRAPEVPCGLPLGLAGKLALDGLLPCLRKGLEPGGVVVGSALQSRVAAPASAEFFGGLGVFKGKPDELLNHTELGKLYLGIS